MDQQEVVDAQDDDDLIYPLMKEKTLNYKFLMAVQDREFDQAKEIGIQILKVQPDNETILRFMKFLHVYQEDVEWIFEQEELEDASEEDEEVDEVEDGEQVEDEEEEENWDDEDDEDEEDEEEWEYEEEEVEQPIPVRKVKPPFASRTLDIDEQFVTEDTNEGDISMAMETKINEQRRQQPLKPLSSMQMNKPIRSAQMTKTSQANRTRTPVGSSLPKIFPQQKQPPQRPKSTAHNNFVNKKPAPLPPAQYPTLQTKTSVKDIRFPSSMVKKSTKRQLATLPAT